MSNVPLYYIRRFDEHYVSSEMKRGKILHPSYFPCPCGESAEHRSLMVGHPDGLQHLAVWEQIQKWAMRNWKRHGRLEFKSGDAMPVEVIASEIGLPDRIELLGVVLSRLVRPPIRWMGISNGESKACEDNAEESPDHLRSESSLRGVEGKGEERKRSNHAGACAGTREVDAAEGQPTTGHPSIAEGRFVAWNTSGFQDVVTAAGRWKRAALTSSEEAALLQFVNALAVGPALMIEGNSVDLLELVRQAIGSAIEAQAQWNTHSKAMAYLGAIVERCHRMGCMPGQFDRPRVAGSQDARRAALEAEEARITANRRREAEQIRTERQAWEAQRAAQQAAKGAARA